MPVVELSLPFCGTTILRYTWRPLDDVSGLTTDINCERGDWQHSSLMGEEIGSHPQKVAIQGQFLF